LKIKITPTTSFMLHLPDGSLLGPFEKNSEWEGFTRADYKGRPIQDGFAAVQTGQIFISQPDLSSMTGYFESIFGKAPRPQEFDLIKASPWILEKLTEKPVEKAPQSDLPNAAEPREQPGVEKGRGAPSLLIMLALLLMAMLLAGCGGGDPEEEPVDKPPPTQCQQRPELCK
jgi:hypothetical protein